MDGSLKFIVVLDFARWEAEGHGYYVDFPFVDGVVNCLFHHVSISLPFHAKDESYFCNITRTARISIRYFGNIQLRIGQIFQQQARSKSTISVVIIYMFWEFLIGPVVLTLDLLDACINVWMCLINTRVEDGNLDWSFGWFRDIFFVHLFKAIAPVAVVGASGKSDG